MTRIDHAAEARTHIEWTHDWQEVEGSTDAANIATSLIAQAEATLALVEQQRIASLIALGQLQIASGMDGTHTPVGDGGAFRALYPQGENTPLAPDIAAALGIRGSDE